MLSWLPPTAASACVKPSRWSSCRFSANQFGVSAGSSWRQPCSNAGATAASNISAHRPRLSAVAWITLSAGRRASAARPSRSAGWAPGAMRLASHSSAPASSAAINATPSRLAARMPARVSELLWLQIRPSATSAGTRYSASKRRTRRCILWRNTDTGGTSASRASGGSAKPTSTAMPIAAAANDGASGSTVGTLPNSWLASSQASCDRPSASSTPSAVAGTASAPSVPSNRPSTRRRGVPSARSSATSVVLRRA